MEKPLKLFPGFASGVCKLPGMPRIYDVWEIKTKQKFKVNFFVGLDFMEISLDMEILILSDHKNRSLTFFRFPFRIACCPTDCSE